MSVSFPLHNRVGQVYEPFKVRFLDKQIPGLAPDEVLVKVRASAICGSDLHIARGKHPSAPLPVTIGHEFSGDVAAVGGAVTKARVGQRVCVEPCIVCGVCDACRHGDYGHCEHISYTYRMGNGAMADYVVVKEPYIYELPGDMSYAAGALMEPLSVATHAVRRAHVGLGDTVLVVGPGPIGLMVAAMCRQAGAGRVIVAGRPGPRLDMALALRATDTVDSTAKDPGEAVYAMTGGKGADKSFECVGKEECLTQALTALRAGGTCTVVGIYEKSPVQLPVARMVTHELILQGAQGYCWDFPIAIAAAERLPMDRFVTHTFPMDQLQQALDTALDRTSGSLKVVLQA